MGATLQRQYFSCFRENNIPVILMLVSQTLITQNIDNYQTVLNIMNTVCYNTI